MSDLPMTVSDGAPASPYAELMICLPPDWPVKSPMSDRRAYWPVRLLKTIARLPHEYRTWIGAWHSVLNGDPAALYAPFNGVVITPVLNCPDEARTITTGTGKDHAPGPGPAPPSRDGPQAHPGHRGADRGPRPRRRDRGPGPGPPERRMTTRRTASLAGNALLECRITR